VSSWITITVLWEWPFLPPHNLQVGSNGISNAVNHTLQFSSKLACCDFTNNNNNKLWCWEVCKWGLNDVYLISNFYYLLWPMREEDSVLVSFFFGHFYWCFWRLHWCWNYQSIGSQFALKISVTDCSNFQSAKYWNCHIVSFFYSRTCRIKLLTLNLNYTCHTRY